jgi:hypothetical protein
MRKPPMVAHTAAGSSEEEETEAISEENSAQPKRKRAPRKVKTA